MMLKTLNSSVVIRCILIMSLHFWLSRGNVTNNIIDLELTSDEPAVVNAPVGFYAKLVGAETNSSLYNYIWESDVLSFTKKVYNQSVECNITLTVPRNGNFVMKLLVNSGKQTLAKKSISFMISNTIIGKIEVFQPGLHAKSPDIISTKSEANLSFVIHDPHNFFDNYTTFYAWSVNNDIKGFDVNIMYNFSKSQKYDIMLMVTAINDYKPVYYTSLSMQLHAKDPVTMLNITGATSIQHGDLLDIEVSCEGSPPYSYCWRFTQDSNISSTEECTSPTMTTSCDIIIIRYFPKSGNYKLVTTIDNDVDHKVTIYNINVFATAPEPQLSPIIVPLACCCLALGIVVIGVTYYVQARRNYSIEVADFDFQQSDDYVFQTFFERLSESFRSTCNCVRRQNNKSCGYKRIPAQIT